MQGGVPLPRSLATRGGRQKAALLLAATNGGDLRLRWVHLLRGLKSTHAFTTGPSVRVKNMLAGLSVAAIAGLSYGAATTMVLLTPPLFFSPS